jgi:hypothetical protein
VTPINIVNTNTLSPGGHYGAVLFKVAALGQSLSQSSQRIAINEVLVSLIFLSTEGQGVYHLGLNIPKQSIAWASLPSNFSLLFQNQGNVQTTPRGYLNVEGPFNRQISKNIINPNSNLILPGTSRQLSVTTQSIHHAILPGIYTVSVYYGYPGQVGYTVAHTRIIYVDIYAVIAVIFAILLFYVAISKIVMYERRHTKQKKSQNHKKPQLSTSKRIKIEIRSDK